MAPGENHSPRPRVAALAATLLIMGPSTVWAHGDAPHGSTTTGLASLWAFLFVTALLSIWIAGRPHFQPRLQYLRLRIGRTVSWAVIGLLSVHLIALPPHLVHHLAGPLEEGLQCSLFVQGNISEQEVFEPGVLVGAPSPVGMVANCPAPSARLHPIPTPSGRSPPDLCI